MAVMLVVSKRGVSTTDYGCVANPKEGLHSPFASTQDFFYPSQGTTLVALLNVLENITSNKISKA